MGRRLDDESLDRDGARVDAGRGEAAQSPITIVGTSGAGSSVTISNSAPVDAWIVPTNSFSRMARVALGFSTATYSLALARPSATNATGGCWGVASALTGVRSFTFR